MKSGSGRSRPGNRRGGGAVRAFLFLALGGLLGGAAVWLLGPGTRGRDAGAPSPPAPAAGAPRTGRTPAPGGTKPPAAADTPSDFEPAGGAGHGVVALVLDDLGNSEQAAARVARLPGPIALAVLPDAPGAAGVSAMAKEKGWDLLVHLPLSSESGKPEAGEISPSDGEREIEAKTGRAIDRLPGAVGLNNHQGSVAMADRTTVRTLLRTVRDRHLFFLDSRTTPARVAEEEAKSLGTPLLARDVFLDADGEAGLSAAWAKARALAGRKGSAIVIAHPHPATLDFLGRELPELSRQGLRLVKVSELVD